MPVPSRRREPPKPTYWYTCCTKSDVEQILEPGQTFDLHWLAGEPGTPALTTRYMTLRAELVGPYGDPFLNIADGDVRAVSAPDVAADTWEAQSLVSSMVLPADLPDGLFQLRLKVLIPVDYETSSDGLDVMSESMGVMRVRAVQQGVNN